MNLFRKFRISENAIYENNSTFSRNGIRSNIIKHFYAYFLLKVYFILTCTAYNFYTANFLEKPHSHEISNILRPITFEKTSTFKNVSLFVFWAKIQEVVIKMGILPFQFVVFYAFLGSKTLDDCYNILLVYYLFVL